MEKEVIAARTREPCCGIGANRYRLSMIQMTIQTERAAEARNRSAGEALEEFYKLAEAEAKWDVLLLSLAQLQDTLAQSKDLMERGLPLPLEYEALRRQRLEQQAEEVKLLTGIQQTNDELPPAVPGRFLWPLAHLAGGRLQRGARVHRPRRGGGGGPGASRRAAPAALLFVPAGFAHPDGHHPGDAAAVPAWACPAPWRRTYWWR